jgi:alanine racemase
MPSRPYKTWVETSARALRANVSALRGAAAMGISAGVKQPLLMAVVKANAYGHGLTETVRAFSGAPAGQQPDWFGVDSLREAEEVRRAGSKKPVLIMGYVPMADVSRAVKAGFSLTVYDVEHVEAAARAGTKAKPAKLHLKLETGTSRQGVMDAHLPEFAALLKVAAKSGKAVFEGLSTHYANIEDTSDPIYAMSQLARFEDARALLAGHGAVPLISHTAASAAAILYAQTHFTMVRSGIAFYGMWPSKETRVSAQAHGRGLTLTPALTWKSIVAQVKDIEAGTPVSYGLTERVTRKSRVAVIPTGYWDGYDRGWSSIGRVLIRGKRAKVLGRVCMNMFVVDVTDIPGVQPEDEVVLLGSQGDDTVTAEELGAAIGTINYEVVTRINPTLPRVLIK